MWPPQSIRRASPSSTPRCSPMCRKGRIADLVVRVRTRGSRPRVMLIHIEVQAVREKGFGPRIARYNAMLRLRYNLPVLSLALVLYRNSAGLGFQRLVETVAGQELT